MFQYEPNKLLHMLKGHSFQLLYMALYILGSIVVQGPYIYIRFDPRASLVVRPSAPKCELAWSKAIRCLATDAKFDPLSYLVLLN